MTSYRDQERRGSLIEGALESARMLGVPRRLRIECYSEMPICPLSYPARMCFHVLNRAVARLTLFETTKHLSEFLRKRSLVFRCRFSPV